MLTRVRNTTSCNNVPLKLVKTNSRCLRRMTSTLLNIPSRATSKCDEASSLATSNPIAQDAVHTLASQHKQRALSQFQLGPHWPQRVLHAVKATVHRSDTWPILTGRPVTSQDNASSSHSRTRSQSFLVLEFAVGEPLDYNARTTAAL